MIFTVSQATTQLSKLIALALNGEEVIIARGSRPVVKLTPVDSVKPRRVFGAFKGKFELTDAFFEPLPNDQLALWNGESD